MKEKNIIHAPENAAENVFEGKKDLIEYPFTASLKAEIAAFDDLFKKILQGHNPLYQQMIDYIADGSGKKIRPLLVLLSAKLCGSTNQKTIDYAIILELLHTATLIHDDVVDDTLQRRNRPSVNAKYGNQMAVLLGDYVLTLAIKLGTETKDSYILAIFSDLAQNLVEGELSQLISTNSVAYNEEDYFEIIRKKTAILLSTCTEMGALSVGAEKEKVEKLRLIGEKLGLCFQIKDDIFDYYDQGNIGKPTGNDIREGKITLPLIYALNNAPETISSEMKEIIKEHQFTIDNISKLIAFAKEYKGIDYAVAKMENLRKEVLFLLDEFPDSENKNTMIYLVDFIINRKK